jgi:hypothetical protein
MDYWGAEHAKHIKGGYFQKGCDKCSTFVQKYQEHGRTFNPTPSGVKSVIDDVLKEYREEDKKMLREADESIGEKFDESKWNDPLADVMVYTDKEISTKKHEELGYLSGLTDKEKGSNILATITYDGAGYDEFSYSGEYGMHRTPPALELLEKRLKEKFGDKVEVQAETNWALGIYKVQ